MNIFLNVGPRTSPDSVTEPLALPKNININFFWKFLKYKFFCDLNIYCILGLYALHMLFIKGTGVGISSDPS